MGIGMMRRHYENEPDSARVTLGPTGVPEDEAGGVVAIGDEPGTAPTPSHADAAERNLTPTDEEPEGPSEEELQGTGEVPKANEEGASEAQFGDPEHSVDPEGHPVDHEQVEENLEEAPDVTAEGASLGGPATAPEAPSRGASTAVWQDFYKEALGQDPGTRSRDELANDYLGPKPE